jgi:hypothetical protein
MRLEPEHGAPGLWVNRDWQPGTPGAFALIVGASKYPHLAGNTYDLGQLYVSALTAFRVFEWLRDGYFHRDCPLAKCWVLLAPTDDELGVAPAMRGGFGDPTFDGLKGAIKEWTQNMKVLGSAARHSRGFFFFSGHGVEIGSDDQVLLPSDYLAPPNPSLNDAISSHNLVKGLLADPVPLHLLFLDACRNDQEDLVRERIAGAQILNTGGKRNTAVIVDLLRATSSGFRAWQPNMASAGESVFGQALLEGLTNRTLRECSGSGCWIPVYRLQKFVNARVMEILRSYDTLVESPVRLGGEVDDAVVTELPGDVHPPRPGDPQIRTDAVDLTLQHQATFDAWRPKSQGFQQCLITATTAVNYAHDIFGSERMEEIWNSARVYDVKSRSWLPEGAEYVIHRFERDEARKLFRVVFSVPGAEAGCVLEVRQPWMSPARSPFVNVRVPRTFACLLPPDGAGPVRYRMLLNLEYHSHDPMEGVAASGLAVVHDDVPFRWLSRVEVDLAPDNSGALGVAARLWQRYRRDGRGDAVASAEMRELLTLPLSRTTESPLAALIVAIVALRAHRPSLLRMEDGYWLQTLATRAPDMPDAALLWAEQLMRDPRAREETGERPTDWLKEMAARGVPWAADTLSNAVSLVEDYLGETSMDAYAGGLSFLNPDADASFAENLHERLTVLARSSRGNGFCSVFKDLEDLGLLEPTPRSSRPAEWSGAAATA